MSFTIKGTDQVLNRTIKGFLGSLRTEVIIYRIDSRVWLRYYLIKFQHVL